jgi:crotonobetainyl-CoA:carnitine CoA-transferase CaiB-like acyl-CoA transferase
VNPIAICYRLPPPLFGEHTSAILQSLGYSAQDVRAMASDSAT